MRLVVLTPQSVVVDEDVVAVRAEDATGSFGILDRHADFLTTLPPSVVAFRRADGSESFVAVRGGFLVVEDRRTVEITTREAIRSDDLAEVRHEVEGRLRRIEDVEATARQALRKFEGALVRKMTEWQEIERRRAGGSS